MSTPNSCLLTWNGIGWTVTSSSCPPGTACAVPARDGFYIGEVMTVPCFGDGEEVHS